MINQKVVEAKRKIRENSHHLIEKAFIVSSEGGPSKLVLYAVMETIRYACIKIWEHMLRKNREHKAAEETKIIEGNFNPEAE